MYIDFFNTSNEMFFSVTYIGNIIGKVEIIIKTIPN